MIDLAELIRDVANYIINNSLATSIGADIFLDNKPDQPDSLISIFEYAGTPTTTGVSALDRRIQILVRNKSYSVARSKAWAIFNLLDKSEGKGEGIILTQNRVSVINALQQPFKLETDVNERSVFICNYAIATTRD